jgi:two-component system KDP operon response regulator KdpE
MNDAHTILIVDDEPAIRRLLHGALDRAGYKVAEAATAREALAEAEARQPAVVLLDLGLPDRDGLELLPLLQKQGKTAILVISAREATEEKVAALDLGAIDFVAKPFDTEELLARVRVALRGRFAGEDGQPQLRAGDVVVDFALRRITKAGVEVHLTPKEFAVLVELGRHPGRVITHEKLLAAVWPGSWERHVEYLRVVVRTIRQKLEDDPARPAILVNELGVGYRLLA